MYGNNNDMNRFNPRQMFRPRVTHGQSQITTASGYGQNHQSAFPRSHFNAKDNPSPFNHQQHSTFSQRVGNEQQYGNGLDVLQNQHHHLPGTVATPQVTNNSNQVYNLAMIPAVRHDSSYQQNNNPICNREISNYEMSTIMQNINPNNATVYKTHTGNYGGGNNAINQLQMLPHSGHQGQPFQHNNIPLQSIGFNPRNFQAGFYMHHNQLPLQTNFPPQPVSQADADKIWLKQWLQEHQSTLSKSKVDKPTKSLKISEAKNLFQRYLNLNNQLKDYHNELKKNMDSEPEKWNSILEKAEKTKEEIMSVQNVLNDQDILQHLEEKIHKRKQKRLWWKNRQRRRYLEKQENEEKRKVLHEKIDLWQKEIREKDVAARKAASLKHEAGGVLGEVKRKLQDCHKLQELIKSLVKLREVRKSEGEKKGVYPKTSSNEDDDFIKRCEYVEKMVEIRIKTYDEEEKALRVIIMEEEGEREKKEKQERLEQKALLNLSKEDDPLAEYRRYYEQADESFQYLVQIRRDWDMYPTNDVTLGSRIPDEDITAGLPTSSLWSSFLKTGE